MMKNDRNGRTFSGVNSARDAVGALSKDKKLSRSARSATIATRVLLGTMDAVARNIRKTERHDMKSDTGDAIQWRKSWKKSRTLMESEVILCKKQKAHYLYMNFKDLNDRKYK